MHTRKAVEPRLGPNAPIALAGLGIAAYAVLVVTLLVTGYFGPLTYSPTSGTPSPGPAPTPSQCTASPTSSAIGGSTDVGPALPGAPVDIFGYGWAEGGASLVATPAIETYPGSTLLVFVGYVGPSIGGPRAVGVCDTAGDTFVEENPTTPNPTNHSVALFVAYDVLGGGVVVDAQFADTSAVAGGTLAVVDVSGASEIEPANVTVVSANGVGSFAELSLGTTGPSLAVLGISGQGHDGAFAPIGSEVLLDTTGYYDVGPWTDGEALGTFALVAPTGSTSISTQLSQAGVWNAFAVAVTD